MAVYLWQWLVTNKYISERTSSVCNKNISWKICWVFGHKNCAESEPSEALGARIWQRFRFPLQRTPSRKKISKMMWESLIKSTAVCVKTWLERVWMWAKNKSAHQSLKPVTFLCQDHPSPPPQKKKKHTTSRYYTRHAILSIKARTSKQFTERSKRIYHISTCKPYTTLDTRSSKISSRIEAEESRESLSDRHQLDRGQIRQKLSGRERERAGTVFPLLGSRWTRR